MRGIRTAGVGITIALSATAGFAQDPGRQPAARFGKITILDPAGGVQPAELVVRGQTADPPRSAPPMPTGVGQGGTLQMPRALPAPNVFETRGPAGAPTTTFAPPAASFASPVPLGSPVPGTVQMGQPIPVGPPVPVGSPVPVGVFGPGGPTPAVPSVFPGDGGPGVGPAPGAPDLDAPQFGGYTGPSATGLLTTPRLALNADMLLWFVRSPSVPTLVTTGTPASSGILGNAGTRSLFGGSQIGDTFHTGGRFGAVYWFGCERKWGLDGDLFFLRRNSNNYAFNTATDPLLARPFVNLNQGIPFSEVVAAPGLANGGVVVSKDTYMWGSQANLRRNLTAGANSRLDMFAGFRYLNMTEGLGITEVFARTPDSPLTIGNPNIVSGNVVDRFRTENNFYGAQVGLAGELRRGRWFVDGRASVAMGQVHESVRIDGAQFVQYSNGQAQAFPGGLLALPGNIGTFTQRRFGVLPEVGVKIGYQVTQHMRLAVGYNFLYLNSVLRPGDQIDQGVDVSRIPNFPLPGTVPALTTVRPAVPLRDSGVFAQGVNFTLQYAW